MLGTTKRSDGKLQVTYAGHPLYFFAEDTQAGQTKGQALNFFGAPWYVVAPGVCIFLLVLALNTLGDALRDTLDPRVRGH